MRTLMKRREGDYMRRVEKLEGQLEKYRQIVRENKGSKEQKKKEIENALGLLMDTLVTHEEHTVSRMADLEDLFGGTEDSQHFDHFIRQF